jgi:hypothetical protein
MMDNSERKEKRLKRTAERVVRQARKKEEHARGKGPTIYVVIGPKGGIGKTALARVLIDKFIASSMLVNIVQIDRTPQLPKLYGEAVSVVHLPGAEELRGEPLAAVVAMEPLSAAIEASIRNNMPMVVDVGGGPSASGTVEYIGKARLDSYLQRRGVRSIILLLLVPEPAAMTQSIELGRALEVAFPSAEIVSVLNERDGRFRFFPGSAADQVWSDSVAPFLFGRTTLRMPALPAGALAPFDMLGFTFTGVINTDEEDIARRLGCSRAIAATLQGDVAAWLDGMWTALDDVLSNDQENDA